MRAHAREVQTLMWRQQDGCTIFKVLLCWWARQQKRKFRTRVWWRDRRTSPGSVSKQHSMAVLIKQKTEDFVWFAPEEQNRWLLRRSRSWGSALIMTNTGCRWMGYTPSHSSFIRHEQVAAVYLVEQLTVLCGWTPVLGHRANNRRQARSAWLQPFQTCRPSKTRLDL